MRQRWKNSSQTRWWNYWAVGLFHVTQLHTCQREIPVYSVEACDPFWPSNMCGRGFIFQQDIDPEHAWKRLCTGPVWCPGKSQQCWLVRLSPTITSLEKIGESPKVKRGNGNVTSHWSGVLSKGCFTQMTKSPYFHMFLWWCPAMQALLVVSFFVGDAWDFCFLSYHFFVRK